MTAPAQKAVLEESVPEPAGDSGSDHGDGPGHDSSSDGRLIGRADCPYLFVARR
jgi:hypothetical protein